MPRKKIELSNLYPYHVCARSNNKQWFDIPLGQVYEIYGNVLIKTCDMYEFKVHAFVLMSNHFHMLLSTPKNNLSMGMRYFMTESSRSIARASCRINRIYGSRYSWTIIKSSEHYAHAFKYVYQNPLRAGLVSRTENYPWSTLFGFHKTFGKILIGNANGFDEYIPNSERNLLNWLNYIESEVYYDCIRKALRKTQFKINVNPSTGKTYELSFALHPKKSPGTF